MGVSPLSRTGPIFIPMFGHVTVMCNVVNIYMYTLDIYSVCETLQTQE